MESEGPYKIRKGYNYGVVVPGIPSECEKYDLTPDIANMIYAEGRKAAEKDFDELLEFANRIEEFYPGRYEYVERFKAWKKARGIE